MNAPANHPIPSTDDARETGSALWSPRPAEALSIGYLVQQFPPEVGAGPARVTEMATHWLDAQAAVTVFTGMPNRPQGVIHPDYQGRLFVDEDWKGMRVHRSWLYASPKPGFLRTIANNVSFMATAAARALSRARKVDVLIASSPPFFVHIAGEFASRVHGIPLVLEIRDLWPDYLVGMGVVRNPLAKRALFALERYLLSRAEHVVVVTESFKRRVAEKGVDPARISVIPNGVDVAQYYKSSEPAPLPALERRGEEFVVGYLGNFGAGQDLCSVVDAMALLAARKLPIRLVIVGDGPERQKVRDRVAEHGLTNVEVHGAIPKDQTRAFYNACDLCLVPLAGIPIFQETVPSKIFEVMACERPLLASLSGEGAKIVNESGGGMLAEPGNPQSIADGIERFTTRSAEELARMGAQGREYVQANYSRDALARRYLGILEAAARARR